MRIERIMGALCSAFVGGWTRLRDQEPGSDDYLRGLQRGYFQGLKDAVGIHSVLGPYLHGNTMPIEHTDRELTPKRSQES